MTLGVWLLTLVVAVGINATLLGSVLTSEGEITSNPESERGYELIGRHVPRDPQDASTSPS